MTSYQSILQSLAKQEFIGYWPLGTFNHADLGSGFNNHFAHRIAPGRFLKANLRRWKHHTAIQRAEVWKQPPPLLAHFTGDNTATLLVFLKTRSVPKD